MCSFKTFLYFLIVTIFFVLHFIFIGERTNMCDAYYSRYPYDTLVNEWWFNILDSFTISALVISIFMLGFSSGISYKQETIDSIRNETDSNIELKKPLLNV